MDSEGAYKAASGELSGHKPNYRAWWGALKASLRGKLGGAVIGAIIGSIVAGLSVAVLAPFIPALPLAATFLAITAYGIKYGANEFSSIGKIVGTMSSFEGMRESREATRLAVLEHKLDDLSGSIMSHCDRLKEQEAVKSQQIYNPAPRGL